MDKARKDILNMLADGTITTDEATELLEALDERKPENDFSREAVVVNTRGRKPSKLRVSVDTHGMDDDIKKAKVNIAIPLGLVRTALPIVMRSIPQSAVAEMEKQNVDLPGIFKLIDQAIDSVEPNEDIVNIDAGDSDTRMAKVRVYFE